MRPEDSALIAGGIVHDADEVIRLDAGGSMVFHPASAVDEIAAAIGRLTRVRRAGNV